MSDGQRPEFSRASRMIERYVDPKLIAYEMQDVPYYGESSIDDEEAAAAAQLIMSIRKPKVLQWMREEIANRQIAIEQLTQDIDTQNVLCLDNYFSAYSHLRARNDMRGKILDKGTFLDYDDFLLGAKLTYEHRGGAPDTYVMTGSRVFNAVVVFLHGGNPKKQEEVAAKLTRPEFHFSYRFSPRRQYFVRAEALLPYAEEKVTPDFKIPKVGRTGRQVLRAVLYDEEDVDAKINSEREWIAS